MLLSFVPAVSDIFTVNVSIPGFQLADEFAFRVSAVTKQYPLTHIET